LFDRGFFGLSIILVFVFVVIVIIPSKKAPSSSRLFRLGVIAGT
jgi:hypothetical protein